MIDAEQEGRQLTFNPHARIKSISIKFSIIHWILDQVAIHFEVKIICKRDLFLIEFLEDFY